MQSTITIHPDHIIPLTRRLARLDWNANERGDVGNADAWERGGDYWHGRLWDAVDEIDSEDGTIDGPALADCLDDMSRLERAWGDDPQTRLARLAISETLGWNTTDRLPHHQLPPAHSLLDLLRSDS